MATLAMRFSRVCADFRWRPLAHHVESHVLMVEALFQFQSRAVQVKGGEYFNNQLSCSIYRRSLSRKE